MKRDTFGRKPTPGHAHRRRGLPVVTVDPYPWGMATVQQRGLMGFAMCNDSEMSFRAKDAFRNLTRGVGDTCRLEIQFSKAILTSSLWPD